MQKVIVAGVVSSVKELKQVGDRQVFNFSIAVSNGKDKDGNWRDSTFWDCSLWDKRLHPP
jgi:single-strand DNA-binding protein